MISIILDLMIHPKDCIVSGRIKKYTIPRFLVSFLTILVVCCAFLKYAQSPTAAFSKIVAGAFYYALLHVITIALFIFLYYFALRLIIPKNTSSKQIIRSDFRREILPLLAFFALFKIIFLAITTFFSVSQLIESFLLLSVEAWVVFMLCMLSVLRYKISVKRSLWLILAHIAIQPVSYIVMAIGLYLFRLFLIVG